MPRRIRVFACKRGYGGGMYIGVGTLLLIIIIILLIAFVF
jgi:hypothetical protein